MGGVLRSNDQRTWLVPTADYRPESYSPDDEALQLYPMLVESGRIGISRNAIDDWVNRTAVGVTWNGDIFIAGVFSPDEFALSLYDFAAILMVAPEDGGADAKDALNFDGGPGAHVYVPSIARHWGYDGEYYVGNVVRVVHRSIQDQ